MIYEIKNGKDADFRIVAKSLPEDFEKYIRERFVFDYRVIPEVDKPTARERIKEYRTLHHMTQTELAEKLGTSMIHCSKIERGEVAVSKKVAKKLAELFECDWRDLL